MNSKELAIKISTENPVNLDTASEIVKELHSINYNINYEYGVNIPIFILSNELTPYISNNMEYKHIIPSLVLKYKSDEL